MNVTGISSLIGHLCLLCEFFHNMLLFKFIICTQVGSICIRRGLNTRIKSNTYFHHIFNFFKLMLYFLFGAVLYLPMKLSHIKTKIFNFIELLHPSKMPTSPFDVIVPVTFAEESTSVKPTSAETFTIRPRPLTVCKTSNILLK